ncbi:glycerophosphodiester phosphodiesterase gdpdl3 [Quercus suber]|uniref:glycerophosphodiester phosphodiesterase n=1 Tax=Quercus suber TaxID=58331 RepID=A0AAW0IR15_QUESU
MIFRILLLAFVFHLPHSPANPLVISKYGASGDFPGCMDLSYRKAIDDHKDVLDCLVQLAKDGTLFTINFLTIFKLFCTGHCRGQGTLEAEEVTLAAEDFFYDFFEDPD